MKEKTKELKLILHPGPFHADDILCAAVMKLKYPGIKIERKGQISQEEFNDPNVIVCDVGKKYEPELSNLDHHNDCPNIKGTDVKMSAIGLLMKHENLHITPFFEDALTTVQAIDNGITLDEYNDVGSMISKLSGAMNPTWDSNKSFDERFETCTDFVALNFALSMVRQDEKLPLDYFKAIDDRLEKEQANYDKSVKKAEILVNEALKNSDGHTVVMEKFAPWQDVLVPSSAEFVIFPAVRGGYMLQCVPPELGSFDKKIELPDWFDKAPEGMIFEHPGKFCASFETKEQAIEASEIAFKEHNKSNDKSFKDK